MTDWPAVIPPPAVATALMRVAQPAPGKRIVAPADSGNIGNDAQNRHKPPDAHIRHPVVVPPRPDADRPTGPPPAFEANVLEAEAERRRQKPAETEARANAHHPVSGETQDSPVLHVSRDGADYPSPPSGPGRPAARYYSELINSTEPQLDLIR